MAARAIAFTVTGFFVFGAVVAMLSAAGSPTAGKTLAIVILSAPLVMLLLAGASRLIARREPAGREPGARPQQTALNEQARTFLFIAGFAALCVVVLVVHAELRAETGFADAVAWIVLLAFVASVPVGLVVLFGLMLVPTAQLWLRSIAGPRKISSGVRSTSRRANSERPRRRMIAIGATFRTTPEERSETLIYWRSKADTMRR